MLRRLPGSQRALTSALGTPAGTPPQSGELRHVVYLPTWLRWDTMRQRPQFVVEAMAQRGHPATFVDIRQTETRRVDGIDIVPDLTAAPPRGVLLYVHYPPLVDLVDRFSEAVVVYDVLDDLALYHGPDRGRVLEGHEQLISGADLVTVSSAVLADRHRRERPDLLIVPNGVDVDRFRAPMPRPSDLPRPGRPLVGYHGAIERWFDFDLASEVARARPDWEFALVGPVGRDVAAQAASLERFDNVTLLGERPSSAMPAYVQAFDVAAIWFIVDELTSAVSPLKMFESLAAGTPVVATPLPACKMEEAVRIASDVAGMIEQLQRALDDRGDPAFEAAPTGADWQERLSPVSAALETAGLLRVR